MTRMGYRLGLGALEGRDLSRREGFNRRSGVRSAATGNHGLVPLARKKGEKRGRRRGSVARPDDGLRSFVCSTVQFKGGTYLLAWP